MSLKLEELSKQQTTPKAYIAYVKEKFGCLNVYLASATMEMYNLSREYEFKSESVCEDCGDSEKTVNSKGKTSWVRTLCKDCRKVYEKGRT